MNKSSPRRRVDTPVRLRIQAGRAKQVGKAMSQRRCTMRLTRIVLALFILGLFSATLVAQEIAPHPAIFKLPARAGAGGERLDAVGASSAYYHGGPVLIVARMVFLFWGPSFANVSSPDYTYAQTLQAYRDQLGTTGEYNVLTQYYQIVGGVKQYVEKTHLGAGTPDEFDTSNPPTNVTDTDVQAEVKRYLAKNAFDSSTIYAVVIPSTSYSSDSGEDSCGGPSLAYCAYRSWYTSGSSNVLYTIQPYPSCSGCQVSGWTPAQNQEHFVHRDTIESVTDPFGTSWWDSNTGEDLSEQCSWSPAPFLSGGYGYQYTWSLQSSACVKTQ
jgi:hypothetical protein